MRSDNSTDYRTNNHFPMSGRNFLYGGNRFCSRSEAACAALMQRYLGFRAVDGISFQVNIGENAQGALLFADFVVRGVVFEYHPIQKPTDPAYWRMLKKYPPGERAKFREGWNNNESQRYYDKRRAQLDANPHFKNAQLIVAQSPQEFYEKVLLPFLQIDLAGEPWRIPSCEQVVHEFRRIQTAVVDLNDPHRARHIRVRYRRAA